MSKQDPTEQSFESLQPALSLSTYLLVLVAAVTGAIAAVAIVPPWLPVLSQSLTGTESHGYWYLSRSSALVAYIFLWFSMATGLSITNKMARIWPGGPTAFDLHQFTSLLGLAFATFHALILLGDHYVGYNLLQILVPFGSTNYEPVWVGLGQIALYLTLPLTFSFYVRRRIGQRAWRILHYTSFAVYFMATYHGLGSGTDSTNPAILAMYGLTGLTIYLLIMYRIYVSMRRQHRVSRAN